MWEKILRPFLSLYIIGAIGEASEPKCIKAECDNKQASGSSYSTKSHSSSNKSNPYASYDSGYDSIYDDGDYDYDYDYDYGYTDENLYAQGEDVTYGQDEYTEQTNNY